MKGRGFVITLALTILLLLAACTAAEDEAPATSDPALEATAEEMARSEEDTSLEMVAEGEAQPEHLAADEAMDEDMADESDKAMDDESEEMAAEAEEGAMSADLPAWQLLALTNARTGESFTLSDFADKTVFVEPMATWCTNCRRQLGNVKDAFAQLAGEDVVFIALSVETTIDDATLANYADEAGFDWLFAVLSPEMLQELAADFGQTIANPPSTPHFVIRPDGTFSSLRTGIEPTDEIIAQIQLAQG